MTQDNTKYKHSRPPLTRGHPFKKGHFSITNCTSFIQCCQPQQRPLHLCGYFVCAIVGWPYKRVSTVYLHIFMSSTVT